MDLQKEKNLHGTVVSIGMPVFNAELKISKVIESILNQNFKNIELIISDNASTDNTVEICKRFSDKDIRVKFFSQKINIGAAKNFKFVLDQAKGEYFMWAAADDMRSRDFISINYNFLQKNIDYVASTSPNCFEGDELDIHKHVNFSLDGSLKHRFKIFLKNCWQSHGIFYSLMRTNVIRECEIPGKAFMAGDWAVNLFLASKGKINRSVYGLIVFGRDGVSSSAGARRIFRTRPIETIIPLFQFSIYVIKLMKLFDRREWVSIFIDLLFLNLKASIDQLIDVLYLFYCSYIKQKIFSNYENLK